MYVSAVVLQVLLWVFYYEQLCSSLSFMDGITWYVFILHNYLLLHSHSLS